MSYYIMLNDNQFLFRRYLFIWLSNSSIAKLCVFKYFILKSDGTQLVYHPYKYGTNLVNFLVPVKTRDTTRSKIGRQDPTSTHRYCVKKVN